MRAEDFRGLVRQRAETSVTILTYCAERAEIQRARRLERFKVLGSAHSRGYEPLEAARARTSARSALQDHKDLRRFRALD